MRAKEEVTLSERKSRREFLAGAAAAGLVAGLPACTSVMAGDGDGRRPRVISTWKHGLAANEAAWKVLSSGGSALDAVEAGVRISEADPKVRSVGYGGRPNADGVVQLDAAIMDGATRQAGGVAAIERIKHPISVARRVMERTPHVLLVGDGARRFAVKEGFPEEDLLTPDAKAAWEKWKTKNPRGAEGKDTIGMVAIDKQGRMAASCTTSGIAYKLPGRVGDSPLIGSGLYCDGTAGGASATGVGEEVIKVCGTFLVVEGMRRGLSPTKACEAAVARILDGHPENGKKQVGFIALSPKGEVGGACVRGGFSYAVMDETGNAMVKVKALGD